MFTHPVRYNSELRVGYHEYAERHFLKAFQKKYKGKVWQLTEGGFLSDLSRLGLENSPRSRHPHGGNFPDLSQRRLTQKHPRNRVYQEHFQGLVPGLVTMMRGKSQIDIDKIVFPTSRDITTREELNTYLDELAENEPNEVYCPADEVLTRIAERLR